MYILKIMVLNLVNKCYFNKIYNTLYVRYKINKRKVEKKERTHTRFTHDTKSCLNKSYLLFTSE